MNPQQAIALGWSIIPTKLDKRPKLATWSSYQVRKPTEAELAHWSKGSPAAWAVVTGAISGIITLDFDGELGRRTMEPLGLKPHRRTPSGGFHVDFIHPGWRVSTWNRKAHPELGRRWPGLDVKGDGGYVCFIVGRSDKGEYIWLRDPDPYELSMLPAELVEFLKVRTPTTAQPPKGSRLNSAATSGRVDPERLIRTALETAHQRGRNNGGLWLAVQLRDNSYSQSETEAIMGTYANRCPSTNTKGESEPYGDSDIRATIRAVYSRPARDPWQPTVRLGPESSHEEGQSNGKAHNEDGYRTRNRSEHDQGENGVPVSSTKPNADAAWPAPIAPEALHGIAGEIVRAIEPNSESDVAALLVQFLIGFGNAVGRIPYHSVGADMHYLNLYAVLVGATSKGRKGSSWSPIRTLLEAADEAWHKRLTSGLSSGEGLIWAVRDPVEKQEAIRAKDKQVTGYQTIIDDPGETDKRLMVVEAEFVSALRVAERDGSTLSALIRQAWDTGYLRTLTKSPLKATGAHVSIIGHITRDELLRALSSTDSANGFANRFLWVCVKRSKFLPEGGNFGLLDFAPLIRKLTEAIDFARRGGKLSRDEETRELWAEVYPRLAGDSRSGIFCAITGRAEAITLRLSCIYALLDKSNLIRLPHLCAALEVWQYAEDSARFIFGDSLGDAIADTILNALRTAREGLTRTDISHAFDRNKKAEQIQRALDLLKSKGLATCVKQEGSGRLIERWRAA